MQVPIAEAPLEPLCHESESPSPRPQCLGQLPHLLLYRKEIQRSPTGAPNILIFLSADVIRKIFFGKKMLQSPS